MKWVFLLALLIGTPALAGLLRSQPRYLVHTCFVLGVSMLLLGPSLWAAPIGWPAWPAPVKGLEVSFVDGISLALLVSTRKVRIPSTIKVSFAVICVALFVSTILAQNAIAALYYIWEFLRTTLLFLAIARVCATEPRAPVALVAGLAVGLMGEAAWVTMQYARAAYRPGGSFVHSNILGIASDFVVFPALALLLGTRRLLWPGLAIAGGGICVVLGGSRASMGLFAIGVVLTIFLSIRHQHSSRKSAFAGAMALLLLVSAPAMVWSEGRRSDAETASSDQQRAAMKEAASMVIADHPFGVGANQYVVVSNVGGYSARAGVAWNESTRRAPVHDTYYLVTAELGFIGLIGLLALLGSFIGLGLKSLRRHLPDDTGELVPGLLAAMIVVSVHISYEFAFVEFIIHYLLATSAGILVAVSARAKKRIGGATAVTMRGRVLPA